MSDHDRTAPVGARARTPGPGTAGAALAGLLWLCAACGGDGSAADLRARNASSGAGDIVVAAPWPWEDRPGLLYEEGLRMAVEEVNRDGGIRGREMTLEKRDDGESVTRGRLVARELGSDPDVLAVIGHLQSYVTVPASVIYDMSGLVQIAPVATASSLTRRGSDGVFRLVFTDHELGATMAEYAARQGFRRVAIYYVRNRYGRALANAFEERALQLGVGIPARSSYDAEVRFGELSLQPEVAKWRHLEPDALFLAAEVPEAGRLVRAFREAGVDLPVIGGDAMSSEGLIRLGGEATEGTVVGTIFHPGRPDPEVRRFVERFRERHGGPPDVSAALGYDAVRLLAHAMRRAPTADPEQVARALHGLEGWEGVTGRVAFDSAGNRVSTPVVLTVVRDGAFEYLETAGDEARAAAGGTPGGDDR